jgi:CSLREA domain-containing protein
MKFRRLLAFGLIIALMLAFLPIRHAGATTFTVDTTSDEGDGSCSDGDCSLRDAIILANANPGADTIWFNIPGTDPNCMGGVCTIYPTSGQLPVLSGGGTTIDGYTQPGASPASAISAATIKIVIDGINLTDCPPTTVSCNALLITSSSNTIKGLAIYRFQQNAIVIGALTNPPAAYNVVQGNYIGVSTMGTSALGNGWDGIFIGGYAENNMVGGDEPAERNLISGNNIGVDIFSAYASGNQVIGNYIGSARYGSDGLPNTLDGVRIYGGAHDNVVGGITVEERNVIMANGRSGVRITGEKTAENSIVGNYIGMDRTGMLGRGNATEGIYIGLGAHENQVGGEVSGARNLISANLDHGVLITGTNTMSNTVSGNLIGFRNDQTSVLGNHGDGILIGGGASYNTIGGDSLEEHNYVSGNHNGVVVLGSGSDHNLIIGNYIGTTIAGNAPLPNLNCGVVLADGAQYNRVGGLDGGHNLISGNLGVGVVIEGMNASYNQITGNFIGTNQTGLAEVGNHSGGVLINLADHNVIGGDTRDGWNLISGNDRDGIQIVNGDENLIDGNVIGLANNVEDLLPNTRHGIHLQVHSQNNTIGGEMGSQPRNYIAGNEGDGIVIEGAGTDGNIIAGNMIGFYDAGNGGSGLSLEDGAQNNIISGDQHHINFIVENQMYGIKIANSTTISNLVAYNAIAKNSMAGIMIMNANQNRIGPSNAIHENGEDGIRVSDPPSVGNIFTQNSIGLNVLDGIYLSTGAHGGIQPPVITGESPGRLNGTTCAGCTVEVFASNDTDGEGWIYISTTVADASGSFSLPLVSLHYPHLTATATDATNGTSEFSAVFTSIYPNRIYLPLMSN